jgi:hypothetical protein
LKQNLERDFFKIMPILVPHQFHQANEGLPVSVGGEH